MLTAAKKYGRFILKSLKCNLMSVMEYKKSFIIQSIFMFFNNFFFLIFWLVVFNVAGENTNGITMNDILYLWSLPVIAYGVAFFFFGGTRKLGNYILEGGLDSFLIQPKNILINVMLSEMDFSAFGDLIYGIVIGLVAVKFQILPFIGLVLLGSISSIFYICTEIIVRLLTIKIGNTDNIEHVYVNTLMINFGSYPEAIYGKLTHFLIYTVIPSAYISFVPIKMLLKFDIVSLVIYIVALVIYMMLTWIIAEKVLKMYESGNQIAMKK